MREIFLPWAGKMKSQTLLRGLFILWCLLYLGAWYYELTLPAASPGEEVAPKIVYLQPGTPFKRVAHILAQKGIIRSSLGFTIEALRLGLINKLKAGEYELDPRKSPAEILKTLAEGRVLTHMVTIPEGYNLWEIADLLEQAGLVSREAFLSAASDEKLLKKLHIPGHTAEGYLFPDTYAFYKDMTPEEIITKMVNQFWKVWEEFAPRAKELGLSVQQVITLASIVEKEALVPQERALIASVFWNRLKKGMPLQADPTVRYALKKFRRPLSRRDLRVKNPYNTYLYFGLPPGPICNPGRESIRAVLYPAKTKYLYFVAMGNGRHYFSCTLREHLKAVKRYKRR